jgi:hypothetical protein
MCRYPVARPLGGVSNFFSLLHWRRLGYVALPRCRSEQGDKQEMVRGGGERERRERERAASMWFIKDSNGSQGTHIKLRTRHQIEAMCRAQKSAFFSRREEGVGEKPSTSFKAVSESERERSWGWRCLGRP